MEHDPLPGKNIGRSDQQLRPPANDGIDRELLEREMYSKQLAHSRLGDRRISIRADLGSEGGLRPPNAPEIGPCVKDVMDFQVIPEPSQALQSVVRAFRDQPSPSERGTDGSP